MDLLRKNVIKTVCCGFLLALSSLSFAGSVNINLADADTIASELSGIGVTKAARVIEYRELHGLFTSVEELALVKGIGPKTIELNRDVIVIE